MQAKPEEAVREPVREAPVQETPVQEARQNAAAPSLTAAGLPDWNAFCDTLSDDGTAKGPARHLALGSRPLSFTDGLLTLEVSNSPQMAALKRESAAFEQALSAWLKRPCRVSLVLRETAAKPRAPLPSPEEVAQKPELKYCMKILKARVRDVRRRPD